MPGPGLLLDIVMKLKPIFSEHSDESLQKKCLHGETQNQNKSFNSIVANFSIGKKASVLIYEKMNLIPGKLTLQGCKRHFASKYKEMNSTNK